jgi:hypothetical protein
MYDIMKANVSMSDKLKASQVIFAQSIIFVSKEEHKDIFI